MTEYEKSLAMCINKHQRTVDFELYIAFFNL